MKPFVFISLLLLMPFFLLAQVVTPPPFDVSTPTSAFNTLFYIAMGLLSVVVGQFGKQIPFFANISSTVVKVTAAIIPCIFLLVHFGIKADVMSSIYAALISLFVGAGMYSTAQNLKN